MDNAIRVGDVVSVSEDYRGWQFASERYAPKTNGIVVAIQPNQMDILVEFHGWTDGHNGPDKWTEGPRWYIPVQYLTVIPPLEAPVEPEVSNPSPVVALYPSDLLILKHLRARGSISPMEALVSHGCARLAPRIFNLRKAGHEITTELLTDEGGHRYSRYTLQKEAA